MNKIDKLNELLARNFDAEEGFKLAAEKCENEMLSEYFRRNAEMHNQFATDLRSELTRLGGEENTDTSIEGDVHRTWMSMRAAVASETYRVLVEECKRGQKTAMEDYQDVIDSLDENDNRLSSLLASHKTRVHEIVEELRTLQATG